MPLSLQRPKRASSAVVQRFVPGAREASERVSESVHDPYLTYCKSDARFEALICLSSILHALLRRRPELQTARQAPRATKRPARPPKKVNKDGPCPSMIWVGCPDIIRLPKAWFLDPLRQSMRTLVRPCTGLTRRKQLTIKALLPARCFQEVMQPLLEGSAENVERDSSGNLRPTKQTGAMRTYKYVVRRGSLHDKIFALQDFEKRGPRPTKARWRRSYGCARLFLSHAAERRGQVANVMAMVCGNVVYEYREPTALRRMPRLLIHMFVLSMDRQGHIVWPVDFEVRTKAALRKQARALLSKMMESPHLYPVDKSWAPALTQGTDSRLELMPRRAAPQAAAPAAAE